MNQRELVDYVENFYSRGVSLIKVKNNDYAKKFVGMVQNNVVGPDGFRLQVRIEDRPGVPDRLASAAIEAAWADWCKAADITGTHRTTFHPLQLPTKRRWYSIAIR